MQSARSRPTQLDAEFTPHLRAEIDDTFAFVLVLIFFRAVAVVAVIVMLVVGFVAFAVLGLFGMVVASWLSPCSASSAWS